MALLDDAASSLAQIAYYVSIRHYITNQINLFMETTISHTLLIVTGVSMACLMIWIWSEGYLLVTGRSRESMASFVGKALKAVMIVSIATGVAAGPDFGVRVLTINLSNLIARTLSTTADDSAAKCLQSSDDPTLGRSDSMGELDRKNQSLVSGLLEGLVTSTGLDNDALGCSVDRSLIATQSILSLTNKIDNANNDPAVDAQKARANWFFGIGTAGPAVIGGTMIIVYQFAMAMFIGFGPIFILCLLWSKTAHLFQKWLMYGIATMFANAMLAVVVKISMNLVAIVSLSIIGSSLLGSAVSSGASYGGMGLMQSAMMQGGLGLILSTLIIAVPPMAANFFNGVLGSANPYSALDRWGSTAGGGSYNPATGGSTPGAVGAAADKNNNQNSHGSTVANQNLGGGGGGGGDGARVHSTQPYNPSGSGASSLPHFPDPMQSPSQGPQPRAGSGLEHSSANQANAAGHAGNQANNPANSAANPAGQAAAAGKAGGHNSTSAGGSLGQQQASTSAASTGSSQVDAAGGSVSRDLAAANQLGAQNQAPLDSPDGRKY